MYFIFKTFEKIVEGEVCCEEWKSDGQCDDINNNILCNYDEGDCCGNDAFRQFCFNCSCQGNF